MMDGRVNGRDVVPSGGPALIPSKSTHGNLSGRINLSEMSSNDRMDAGMLSTFKENPYTHSLHSVA